MTGLRWASLCPLSPALLFEASYPSLLLAWFYHPQARESLDNTKAFVVQGSKWPSTRVNGLLNLADTLIPRSHPLLESPACPPVTAESVDPHLSQGLPWAAPLTVAPPHPCSATALPGHPGRSHRWASCDLFTHASVARLPYF